MATESLVILAKNYQEGIGIEVGNPHGQTPYGDAIHNSHPYTPKPNSVTYHINFPERAKYEISVEYAAAASRPTEFYLNSKLYLASALGATTGSWTSQRWEVLGNFQIESGRNTIHIYRSSYFPHIRALKFILVTSDAPTVDPIG